MKNEVKIVITLTPEENNRFNVKFSMVENKELNINQISFINWFLQNSDLEKNMHILYNALCLSDDCKHGEKNEE